MNACQEILCRAALARTLTQVPGIEYISIYSGDQPLLDKSGMPAGPISAADFVDSITDVNAYERTELTLYFTDANGTLLYPEKRSVMHNVNTSVERVIIEELISGPEQPGLMPTLNSDIKILNVSVNENEMCIRDRAQEIQVQVMGEVQIEVLKSLVAERLVWRSAWMREALCIRRPLPPRWRAWATLSRCATTRRYTF